MPLEAFNSSASIIDVLTGGVNSVGRSLLLGQQGIQTNTVRSIEESFASRIDEAISRLNQTDISPKISALRREQSILASRKARVNEAIEVLNKTLIQTKFLQNAIKHLEDQIKSFENSEITASALATDWDNTLRKINIVVEGATVTYKDGGVSSEKNLIKSDGSRTRFPNRLFLAPYNSRGETLQIDGKYLGVDYFLTQITGGTLFWNSDTAFLDTEAATGTLTEFSSQAGFPGSPTGRTEDVTTINFRNFNSSTLAVRFRTPSNSVVRSFVTKAGLGLLDAWLYNDFQGTNNDGSVNITRAKDDLEQTLGKILLAEAQFRLDLKTLQSRTTLFDSNIVGLEREIDQIVSTSLSEKEAIVVSLKLASQVAQFDLALLASRGDTIVFSLLLSQDNFNNGFGSSFKAIGDALLGATLSIRA